jgi:COMPASS component SWD3
MMSLLMIGQCLKTIIHPSDKNTPVASVEFSPNGQFILSSTLDDEINLWSTQNGHLKKTYKGHTNKKFCIVPSFYYSKDQICVICGSEDSKIYSWDLQTMKALDTMDITEETNDPVLAVHAFSNLIASASGTTMIVWVKH